MQLAKRGLPGLLFLPLLPGLLLLTLHTTYNRYMHYALCGFISDYGMFISDYGRFINEYCSQLCNDSASIELPCGLNLSISNVFGRIMKRKQSSAKFREGRLSSTSSRFREIHYFYRWRTPAAVQNGVALAYNWLCIN